MSRESLYTRERRNGFLCSAATAPLALILYVCNINVNNLNFLFTIVTAIAIRLGSYSPLGAFTNDDCTWPFCSAMQWSMQSVISSNCQSQLSQQHSYTTSCVAFVLIVVVPFNWPPSSFILIARSSQACFSPAGSFLHWNENCFTHFTHDQFCHVACDLWKDTISKIIFLIFWKWFNKLF